MAKRRGNPNWGKPEPFGSAPSVSSFDSLVKRLKLSPDQYHDSQVLKEWVLQNKDHKYVPQELLRVWGFTAKTEI